MKITLQKLIESTNIPEKLVRAVVRQMGGWESFTESAPDITHHGIDGGYHGFIYYSDTEPFAKRNRAEILRMASDQAESIGMGLVEMIKGFNCFRNSPPTEAEIVEALAGRHTKTEDGLSSQVPNALAWYAGEEVARAYCDALENLKWEKRQSAEVEAQKV
jgi:hypothetical protein